jgi:type IV pilus biogenesis protein CpaD/CtpE
MWLYIMERVRSKTMKIIMVLSFLIVSGLSATARNDSSTQNSVSRQVTTQKVVVISESSKVLNKNLPKSKTTWTRIKDLFM